MAHFLEVVSKKGRLLQSGCVSQQCYVKKPWKGGGELGSVVKKRRKKMRKHKHRKLLAKTRHQRRKGK
jgi:hypothetical protein